MKNTKKAIAFQEAHMVHGDDAFNFAFYEYQKNSEKRFFPLHWHDEYEIIYMESGCMDFEIEGRSIHLEANQAIFIDRHQIHACYDKIASDNKYYCIVFGEKFLFPSPLAKVCQTSVQPTGSGRLKPQEHITGATPWELDFLDTVKAICLLAPANRIGFELELQIKLLSLFLMILQNNAYTILTPSQENDKGRIREALSFIHENYQTDIRVAKLAKSLNICNEHFIRSFRAAVGKPPKEYIIAYRINAAASLLKKSDESVTSIAERCGFSDMSYFSKYFRKIKGCSPKTYRTASLKKKNI